MASGYIHFSDENTNVMTDDDNLHYYELNPPAYYNYKTIKIDLSNPWIGKANENDSQLTGTKILWNLPITWIDYFVTGTAIIQVYNPIMNITLDIRCSVFGYSDANNRKNDTLRIRFEDVTESGE